MGSPGLLSLLDGIASCRFLFSSSLHGLIFADSYSVPNAHLRLSTRVLGAEHKFRDYYGSVGRPLHTYAYEGKDAPALSELLAIAKNEMMSYAPTIDLYPFWRACPMHAAGDASA